MVDIKAELEKKKYGLYGESAVQPCLWTKNSLRGKGVCYKQEWYGINCHRCMQFSPVLHCNLRCVYCWRPMEIIKPTAKAIYEEPEKLVEKLIEERKRLLTGFGSFVEEGKLSKEKFEEAKKPNFFTLSLIGEPTLYPKLPELIKLLKKKGAVFLVTNGTRPEMLARLQKEKALPTQLMLTMPASNAEQYKKICRPLEKNCWQNLNQTLAFFPKLKCRKAVEIVVINKINNSSQDIKRFALLVRKASPHFIHVKGYMFLGFSKKRLKKENMPSHEQIKKFAKALLASLPGYVWAGESERSRVVLLKKKGARQLIQNSISSIQK